MWLEPAYVDFSLYHIALVPMQSSYSIIQRKNRRSLHPRRSIYANAILCRGERSKRSDTGFNHSPRHRVTECRGTKRTTKDNIDRNFLITQLLPQFLFFCFVFAVILSITHDWSNRDEKKIRMTPNIKTRKRVHMCVAACFGHFCNISFFVVVGKRQTKIALAVRVAGYTRLETLPTCILCDEQICALKAAINVAFESQRILEDEYVSSFLLGWDTAHRQTLLGGSLGDGETCVCRRGSMRVAKLLICRDALWRSLNLNKYVRLHYCMESHGECAVISTARLTWISALLISYEFHLRLSKLESFILIR